MKVYYDKLKSHYESYKKEGIKTEHAKVEKLNSRITNFIEILTKQAPKPVAKPKSAPVKQKPEATKSALKTKRDTKREDKKAQKE